MSHTETDPKDDGLRLKARLRYLYHGSQPAAVKFRLMVIAVDFAIIAFFLASPILKNMGWAFYALDYFIAAVLALDLAARAYAYANIKDWLKRPIVWVDLFVLATLLFPAWLANLGFLRLLLGLIVRRKRRILDLGLQLELLHHGLLGLRRGCLWCEAERR